MDEAGGLQQPGSGAAVWSPVGANEGDFRAGGVELVERNRYNRGLLLM